MAYAWSVNLWSFLEDCGDDPAPNQERESDREREKKMGGGRTDHISITVTRVTNISRTTFSHPCQTDVHPRLEQCTQESLKCPTF